MNKKYIFLPVAGLIILSIGYYFFSLYRNSDNSPNESKTQPIEQTADTSTPTDEGDTSPIESNKADITSAAEDSNSPCGGAKQITTTDTTTPTDEDNLPNETNQQNVGEQYTVFVFYGRSVVEGMVPYQDGILVPLFEVDLKHKTIKGIRKGFKKKKTYYEVQNGCEVYPESFGNDNSTLTFEDYEIEYVNISNDDSRRGKYLVSQGGYFIDEKVDLGEQPKTTANIKLFFEAFFKNDWGKYFYEADILNDIKSIERRTDIFIEKITDMDKDGNLEYWLDVHYSYGSGDKMYEVEDGKLVFIQEFYYEDGH